MSGRTENRFEAWLDAGNRIVSFHEIPAGQYYSAEDHTFWQQITSLILSGYRVRDPKAACRPSPCKLPFSAKTG